MCPLCAATVIMTVAGGSSAGGAAALVVRKLRPGARAKAQAEPPRGLSGSDKRPN